MLIRCSNSQRNGVLPVPPSEYNAVRENSAQQIPLRNTKAASRYLEDRWGVRRAPAYLAKLRVVGGGPEFVKVGARDVAYTDPALDAYAQSLISKPLRSTSEAA